MEGESETEASVLIKIPRLNDQRLSAVLNELKASGAKTVLDMGCGEGHLLQLLIKELFYRVHEFTFAVLALENETVDPRL